MSLAPSIYHDLVANLDVDLGAVDVDEHLRSRLRSLTLARAPLTSDRELERIEAEVLAHVDGLGPLHSLSTDPAVTEIMVNGDGSVYVEVEGELRRSDVTLDATSAEHLVRRLAARAGRRIDAVRPAVDVRLSDGSRLHAIIPPLAVDGVHVTIRRFSGPPVSLDQLAAPQACGILRDAVAEHQTIVVAGATSSGKTTLLNALGGLIPPTERVVTIEDAAELRLPGEHVVRLETRPASEGVPATGIRELVRNALRMRPDRIICGEMRGAEAFDLVQALNTGHSGSLSTVHASSAQGALSRIETMMLLAEAELPLFAIREQLAASLDVIVMMARGSGGARLVQSIHTVSRTADASGWELIERYVR